MIMKFDYDGLWKLLIDKKMKKKDLTIKLGIFSTAAISKITKGKLVLLTVLGKIETELGSDIGEIVCLDNES